MAKVDTWMPFYIDDYLGDTMDLSTLEHGAYLLMLFNLWKCGGRLPNDPARLAATTKLRTQDWKKIGPRLISRYFDTSPDLSGATPGFISQKRVVAELTKAKLLIEKKRLAGIASAEKRQHLFNTCSTPVPTDDPTDGQQTPQHNALPPPPPLPPPTHIPPSSLTLTPNGISSGNGSSERAQGGNGVGGHLQTVDAVRAELTRIVTTDPESAQAFPASVAARLCGFVGVSQVMCAEVAKRRDMDGEKIVRMWADVLADASRIDKPATLVARLQLPKSKGRKHR